MLKEERKKKLLEIINSEKAIAIADLCERTGVSQMTIWRDLGELAAEGAIERIRGGAIARKHDALPAGLKAEQDVHASQKAAIGRYAAQRLVAEGDFITLEAGTTVRSLIPHLQAPNLTVLTNGLLTSFLAYQTNAHITLMCSGGVLIETGAFIGPQAADFFKAHRVRKAFVGASGLTLEDGFTDPTPLYLPLKKAMMENADQVVMLLDSSKIGARSLLQVAAFDEVDLLVTDDNAPQDVLSALREKGVEVHIAGRFS
ncbi:MAG: DeoR/GlpR family DNA-binding transcription regulator [Chloroflexi bacterium]|nr:DeoR/GlpR family DNA-binding transcription regulator [Chloroflexota bacterium]